MSETDKLYVNHQKILSHLLVKIVDIYLQGKAESIKSNYKIL